MKKARFSYTKSDGTSKSREVLNPKYLRESYNSFHAFDSDKINYVQGYELNKEGLSEEDSKLYEEVINDYFELAVPTIEEFISEQGLDASRIQYKTFKKGNIDGFQELS